MSKETYYQKKKRINNEKISQLYNDIRILIKEPDSLKAMEIKAIYMVSFDLEEDIWQGGHTAHPETHKGIYGILTKIPT